MNSFNRLTAENVEWIDTDKEQPPYGSKVMALGKDGVLCHVVWGKDDNDFFIAWIKYPKIPAHIKSKLRFHEDQAK